MYIDMNILRLINITFSIKRESIFILQYFSFYSEKQKNILLLVFYVCTYFHVILCIKKEVIIYFM